MAAACIQRSLGREVASGLAFKALDWPQLRIPAGRGSFDEWL